MLALLRHVIVAFGFHMNVGHPIPAICFVRIQVIMLFMSLSAFHLLFDGPINWGGRRGIFCELTLMNSTTVPLPAPYSSSSIAASPGVVLAFNWLQLCGALILALIMAGIAVHPRLSRLSTWYNFCLSWIISALSYCLLYIAPGELASEPERVLCVTQSGLVYAAPVLTVGTTLNFVIHIYLQMTSATSSVLGRSKEIPLLITPYVAWSVVVIAVVLRELHESVGAQRVNGLYCTSMHQIIPQVIAAVVLVVILVIIVLQAIIFSKMYSKHGIPQDARISPLLFRILLFNLGSLLGIGVSVALFIMSRDYDNILNLLLASFPLLVAIIFGFQRDVLQSLIYGRSRRENPSTSPVPLQRLNNYSPLGNVGYSHEAARPCYSILPV